jgi:hypothetical protein
MSQVGDAPTNLVLVLRSQQPTLPALADDADILLLTGNYAITATIP